MAKRRNKMAKRRNKKSALMSSIISLILCISMLLGTTIAWFTDTVSNKGNKIESGTLKVDLEVLEDDNATWTSIKGTTEPIFAYDNWEPGYTEVKILRVVNKGSLALKWKAMLVSDATLSELADVIDVYVKEDIETYPTDRTDLSDWTKAGTLTQFINTIESTTYGEIEAKEDGVDTYPYEALGIAFKMQETAGNKYQGMTLGSAFDIYIVATQMESESDSFNNEYDKNAEYPKNVGESTTALTAVYVSSDAKVGEGDGSLEDPFANILEAKAYIREVKADDSYPEEGITVYFREGQYRIDETINFEEADSGEEGAPVTYAAYENEKVLFVGGIDVELSAFSNITDEAIVARLVEGTESNIKQIDLSALGITDYGEMNVYGMAAAYFTNAGIDINRTQPPELFFNDQEMSIARYPNTGWVYINSVIDTGDVIQNWTSAATGNNFVPEEDRPETPSPSIFTVNDVTKARMSRWSKAEEPWVYGYWQETWSDQSIPIASMEADSGTITTKIPSGKKITAGMYFYFYNMLEELDAPGEYFIDRSTGILYFYPPETEGTVTLSLLEGSIIDIAKGTHDIDFVGIEFKAGRSHAFNMNYVERITVKDCDINKFGDRGVYMMDCKDITITGCHLYDLGKGGIAVKYDENTLIGTKMKNELENMGIVVENCEINNFSRIAKTYSPAVSVHGVGMVVKNCKIYDGAHMAIYMSGNDALIENNEIFNVLKENNDSGVIYGGLEKEQMGTVIRNNYIHDISSTKGKDIYVVYCDDTKDGVTVESNLIVNFKGSGVMINGGWDNYVRNNVFVNTYQSVLLTAVGKRSTSAKYDVATSSSYGTLRRVYELPAYQKYPHWQGKLEALIKNNVPMYNEVTGNVIINVDKDFEYSSLDIPYWSTENIMRDNTINSSHKYYISEVGFKDIENGDFTIKEDSVLYTDIEGFKAYDFSKIGLIGKNPEKPSGSLGIIDPPEDGVLLSEDFSLGALDGWSVTQNLPEGCYAKINDTEQLEVAVGAKQQIIIMKKYTEHKGTISYELDFKIDRNGSTDADTIIVGVRGGGKTLAIVKAISSSDANSQVFAVYDGGNFTTYKTNVLCKDGVTYKIKLVVDPETNKFDLYVDNEKIMEDRSLTSDVTAFDQVQLGVTGKSADNTPVVYYDNLVVRKVEDTSASDEETVEALLVEKFPNAGDLDATWSVTKNLPANCYAKVNNAGQLEVAVGAAQQVLIMKKFTEYAGKISYELDFMINRNGSTDVDTNVIGVRGGGKTLAIVKAISSTDADSQVFGVYDGGNYTTYKTSVPCEDGVTYKIKLVVDPATNTFDFYVDNKKIFDSHTLKADATIFDQVSMGVTGKSDANTPVIYYDNLIVQKVEEPGEEVLGDVLMTDEFSDEALTGWSGVANVPANCYVKSNDADQLEIGMSVSGAINLDKSFEVYKGKISYEIDFKLERNGSTDVDAGIMIARGESQSIVNIKAYSDETNGKVFGAYDGNGEHPTTVPCVDGVTYKVKLIVDPETDTYDLYVDNVRIIEGRPLRCDATTFNGIRIPATRKTNGNTPTIYYDNLIIRKVEEAPAKLSSLMTDDFSDSTLSDWGIANKNIPADCHVKVNDAKQLEIGMGGSGAINIDRSFDVYVGKVAYEIDFTLNRNGSTDLDPGIMIARGESQSIVNIKAYCDETNGKVFGAYDGGGEYPTTIPCEDGVTYKVKLIVDPDTDTYDLYVDNARIINDRPLRCNATSFNGIRIAATRQSAGEKATICYDNLDIYSVK